MPFQPINFANITPIGLPGIASAPEQIAKGFNLSQLPEEARTRMLANAFSQMKNEQEPQRFKSEQALRSAQLQKALQPAQAAPSSLEKALSGSRRIAEQYGADSPESKMADTYVKRLAEGQRGMELTIDPQTGALSFSQGGSGRSGQAQEIVDGKLVSKPTMSTSSSTQKAAIANKAFSDIQEDFNQPYKGTMPSIAIGKDLVEYSTMPDGSEKDELAKKLVSANTANRFLPEMSSLQLLSQGTQTTVPALEHQSRVLSSGWPAKMQSIMNAYPKELQDMAEKKHGELMQKASKLKQSYVAKGMPLDLNDSPVSSATKSMKIPEFATRESFNAYYNKLSPADKLSIKEQLKGG
jgi:hypothetical protein